MALNKLAQVSNGHFDGSGRVFGRDQKGLAEILKGLLIRDAAVRLEAESITALTDNSGGAAGGTIAAATLPVLTDISGGVLGATAASINTAVVTVEDAYATLLEQANLVLAELNGGSVGEGDGTAGSGTIAVIDDTVAANTTDNDSAQWSEVNAAFQGLLNNQQTVRAVVDRLRAAVGLAATTQAAGGGSNQGQAGSALEVQSIADATNVTGGLTSVLRSEVDAFLDVLADNVAELADQLDEVTAITEATVQVPQNYAGLDR